MVSLNGKRRIAGGFNHRYEMNIISIVLKGRRISLKSKGIVRYIQPGDV